MQGTAWVEEVGTGAMSKDQQERISIIIKIHSVKHVHIGVFCVFFKFKSISFPLLNVEIYCPHFECRVSHRVALMY